MQERLGEPCFLIMKPADSWDSQARIAKHQDSAQTPMKLRFWGLVGIPEILFKFLFFPTQCSSLPLASFLPVQEIGGSELSPKCST